MLADIYLRSSDSPPEDTFLGCAEITDRLKPGDIITTLGITGEVVEKIESRASGEQNSILYQVFVQ